jgi:3-deoxy-D-manno-octulosonic-acid transferase
MINFYDIAYGIGLGLSAPYWLIKPSARRKVLTAFQQRMGRDLPADMPAAAPPGSGDRANHDGEAPLPSPVAMIHAVSLGEMNATRSLLARLREMRPDLRFVISSTTDTGFARGQELYGKDADVTVIRYPLDFTAAVNRVLDGIKPDIVVLMELEVWPNFVKQCQKREIPVVLANARLTPTSYRNYRLGTFITSRMFNRVTLICAQEMIYAERFMKLGVPPHHIVVTGTMKFDTANLAPPSPMARRRAEDVGLRLGLEPVWVCGSTGPGEEQMILSIYRRLLQKFARLRLVIVPRHQDRFDEVEQIIWDNRLDCFRLSRSEETLPPEPGPIPHVILVDAMGVLRDFYSVADVVFVGRSLVDLGPRQHGSDMIEPAALGRPVIVGPWTANFADAMNRFREGDAMLEVQDEESLEQAVTVMLSTPREAAAMGRRAAEVVHRGQGSTTRHVNVILQILAAHRGEEFSARPARPPGASAAPPPFSLESQSPAAPPITFPTTLDGKPVTVGPLGGRGRIVIHKIE